MKTTIYGKLGLVLLTAMLLTALSATVFATAPGGGTDSGTDQNDAAKALSCMMCRIASLIFMVVGGIGALVIMFAGLRWVTSAEDPGARNAAKGTIVSVFVGLAIVIVAVFLVTLVIGGLISTNINAVDWITGSCSDCSVFSATT